MLLSPADMSSHHENLNIGLLFVFSAVLNYMLDGWSITQKRNDTLESAVEKVEGQEWFKHQDQSHTMTY